MMTPRLKALLAAFDPDLPLDRARTIPSAWYFDPEIADLERSLVFGETWQVACRVDQVEKPGDFATCEIAGEPIVVVRGDDGVLRAFANVCRHRAARVLEADQGCVSKLRCRYHGWTYDLAGRLKGTPEFDGVADFRREENGLAPMSVASFGPAVFGHQGRDPRPLENDLSPIPEWAGASLSGLKFAERREYVLNCNWKVFVDNYLDGGYHVNTVHPGLAGVLDYSRYRTEVFGRTNVQLSPLRAPETGKDDLSAATARPGEFVQYWYVYPNYMMNLYQGYMDTNLVLPLGMDRCRVIFDFYFDRIDGAEAFIRESVATSDQIQQEDVGICEEVQRGLSSRTFDVGRFSVRREAGGYHFHQLLGRAMRETRCAGDIDGR